ncbi:MAG: hypothetical protein QMD80_00245 [archaeon]|nr:hypothetical protein [archaeon]
MTRGWAKNLLVKIVIGAVIFFALLSCVQTASASDIEVKNLPEKVSFIFDQPWGSVSHSQTVVFEIHNKATKTVSGSITVTPSSSEISITPNPPDFNISQGGSPQPITLTIKVLSPSALEVPHPFTINIGEEKRGITVTITYCAKITVSPSTTIDFETVGSKVSSRSEKITIREELGYKNVTINVEKKSGNGWVTASPNRDITVSKTKSVDVTFTLTPGPPDYERYDNKYTWKFIITSSNADPVTITVEARIMRPPKLGKLYDEGLEIKFDKPKGTVSRYERTIEVQVRNVGDETLSFTSKFTESPSGITINIVNPSGSVSGKSSETIRLRIVVPYDAREGTYRGRLDINAGDAGSGSVDITIVIIWPVDFIIAPTSIDFGSIELKERGYEKKRINLTLTEFYHYKSVRNLRISKSGEYGNWLKEEIDFYEIPPGESRSFTLKIEPGLEAVPKDYSWMYALSASEIGAKRMEVKAKIVPMNIPEMLEYLKSFRESTLYENYPSSEVIISNGTEMLEAVGRSEIGAEDWQKIPVLMKGTLSLLSSLNDGIVSSEEENYGKTVESLSAASVSTSTIESNSNLNNRDISGYATDMSAGADQTTEEVLLDAAKLLELRGWKIKKAVEHALAVDDISGLKEEENVLESAISYQYAATLYGLLNNKEKRLESVHEGSLLMDKHDELVSDAADLRIKADNALSNSKEKDLIRIGDLHLLLNPYDYDTFLKSYKTAESYLEEATKKYKVSGELLLADKTEEDLNNLKGERRFILSLFFIACIVYGVLFIAAIVRIIGGSMAYMRDMYEREAGDILVT